MLFVTAFLTVACDSGSAPDGKARNPDGVDKTSQAEKDAAKEMQKTPGRE